MRKNRAAQFILILFIVGLCLGLKPQETSAFSGGAGTVGNPYQIATVADLVELNSYTGAGHVDKYFKMTADIDLNVNPYNTGSGWTPLSAFYGHFDGDGHTVSNLYVNTTSSNKGLFTYLYGATEFKNLNITNAYVKGGDTVGVLASSSSGRSYSNINVDGTVLGSSVLGGFIGNVTSTSTFDDIQVDVDVSGNGFAGFGGMFAYATGATITNSSAAGSVAGGSYRAGGLVGSSDSATSISRSFATGNVSSTGEAGGLVGALYGAVTDSYSRGSVTAGSTAKGGFVGFMNQASSIITNSYSTGAVVNSGGTGFLGGLYSGLGCSSAFFDTQTSGKSTTSCTATGKTTVQMKNIDTFTNTTTSTGLASAWDFVGNPNNDSNNNNYWDIDSVMNDGYPYLKWQEGLSAPSVETDSATNITLDSAQINGDQTDDGTSGVTRRGFVWGTSSQSPPGSAEPEGAGYDHIWDDTTYGVGTFNINLSDLAEGTTYYFRAFAQSGDGIAYGNQVSFTTIERPTISSPASDSRVSEIYVDVTINTAVEAGSLNLVFDAGEDEIVLNLTDLAPGQHQFTIDPSNPAATAQVVSSSSANIPDGVYSVVLQQFEYQGAIGLSANSTNVTVDTTAPTIGSLSPVSGAVGVPIDSNLELGYGELVGAESGNLTIYKASDDSIFEVVAAGSGPVSGNGTDTITVNPQNEFEPGEEYYILMDSNFIADIAGNNAVAITNDSTWRFTAIEAPQVLCEMPTSTHETISGRCETQPSGWGATTWEARYKKSSEVSYANLNLDDNSEAGITVDGLEPETEYYLEFRFSNSYTTGFGQGQWARLEITTEEPPQDDYNGDSIVDYYQPNIGSYISPISSKRVVIDVGEACELTVDDTIRESQLGVQDSNYEYESGLWDFEADCTTPGATTTIKLYYYDVASVGQSIRKYNSNTQTYFTIDSATITQEDINGSSVLVAAYQVTDGGELDMDGMANGTIEDPAGLGAPVVTQSSGLAKSGQSSLLYLSVASLITLSSLILAMLRKQVAAKI